MPLTVTTNAKYQYCHQTTETELKSQTEGNQGKGLVTRDGHAWIKVFALPLMRDTNASAANFFNPHAQPTTGIKITQGSFSPWQADIRKAPYRTGDKEIRVF